MPAATPIAGTARPTTTPEAPASSSAPMARYWAVLNPRWPAALRMAGTAKSLAVPRTPKTRTRTAASGGRRRGRSRRRRPRTARPGVPGVPGVRRRRGMPPPHGDSSPSGGWARTTPQPILHLVAGDRGRVVVVDDVLLPERVGRAPDPLPVIREELPDTAILVPSAHVDPAPATSDRPEMSTHRSVRRLPRTGAHGCGHGCRSRVMTGTLAPAPKPWRVGRT